MNYRRNIGILSYAVLVLSCDSCNFCHWACLAIGRPWFIFYSQRASLFESEKLLKFFSFFLRLFLVLGVVHVWIYYLLHFPVVLSVINAFIEVFRQIFDINNPLGRPLNLVFKCIAGLFLQLVTLHILSCFNSVFYDVHLSLGAIVKLKWISNIIFSGFWKYSIINI